MAVENLSPHEILDLGFEPSQDSFIDELSRELLEPSPKLNWDVLDLVQSVPSIDKQKIFLKLLVQPGFLSRTAFRLKRGGIEGSVTGFQEELRLSEVDNANATNSLSITRRLGPKQDALHGKASFMPFQPGGIFNKTQTNQTLNTSHAASEFQYLRRNSQGLFDIPQGMLRGLSLQSEGQEPMEGIDPDLSQDVKDEVHQEARVPLEAIDDQKFPDIQELNDYIPPDYKAIQQQMDAEVEVKRNWAHVVDLNHRIENFEEIVPNMARKWPFELDTFQKEAVYHLEQGDSVFVAAHTSAGKTVVAEYAIAMAARNMTKTIYTSPIKALSNQKFRDFKETFKGMDIGLITGDVQINPDANCLIMTTEILRSMLYRGADLIRDVEFVIFDEVHYVNDIDRGVVWEEVIIMLPDHVKIILLSATVPNTFEFANWVGRTKRKNIHVISTPKRPVPLEIFIWAKNDLYKAINANGVFNESEFKKHRDVLQPDNKNVPPKAVMGSGSRRGPGGTARGGNRGGGRGGAAGNSRASFVRDGPNKSTWTNLVQYLHSKQLLPAVIFVFSKKRCEDYVDTMSGVNFCNAKERSEIHMFIDRAVARLKKEDRELPQILKIRDLLSRGIAVHHGGLLPIVKECIEILFSKSLVKVLFATETFAMGLNLPTRTVVFCELRKHDGRGFRNLFPGEFTQMAGRAGRRGLDTTGTVIVMSFKQPLQPADFKEVTMGRPTKLSSQFRLTYNMILNLLRIEALRVEEMIKHSFSENTTQTLLPEHKNKVEELSKTLKGLTLKESKYIDDFQKSYSLIHEYEKLFGQICTDIQAQEKSKNQVFGVGKLMVFEDEDGVVRCGTVVKSDLARKQVIFMTFDHGEEYEASSKLYGMPYLPVKSYLKRVMPEVKYMGQLRLTSVPYTKIQFACGYTMHVNMKNVLKQDKEEINKIEDSFKMLTRLFSRFRKIVLKSSLQFSLLEQLKRIDEITEEFQVIHAYDKPEFKEFYSQIKTRETIKNDIDSLNELMSDENLELLPDYEQRLKVLKHLDFIDKNQNVMLKGRVACEINSGWELVLTELILDNFLGDFEPEEIVALLSCFVYEGRTNDEEDPPITPRLENGKMKIREITEKLLKIYTQYQVSLSSEEEEFLERKRFALVNVVYEWAKGMTFKEIMQISVELEGTIVRVITRLDEICRQVKNAASIVGDSVLHSKMSEAQERIKRDIVFCASLYI